MCGEKSLIKIRISTLKDLPQILKLEKKNSVKTNENLYALFKIKNPNEKYQLFTAEENGKIVGYSRMHLYKWNNSAYIITVLVDMKHRRKGIGTRLLNVMEEFAGKNKSRILMFDTSSDNSPALQLYFKNGFRICGYNDKIYRNGKTALYLSKEL